MSNPFGCTELEARVLDQLLISGENLAVGIALDMNEKAVESVLGRARRRMGVSNRVLMALKWAEWRRRLEQEKRARAGVEHCATCAGLGFTVRKAA